MEFCEKLQELRKSRGLTQEALAEMLYVSRTAVSKWESGRGYPSIGSLKAISRCFSVSLDDLLSGEAILTIAETDGKQKAGRLRDLVMGLMDCGMALLLFLPVFRQAEGGGVRGTPLWALAAGYRRGLFFGVILLTVLVGAALAVLRDPCGAWWLRGKSRLSLGLSVLGTLIFIAALQPYAAAMAFGFLAVKALLLIKWE